MKTGTNGRLPCSKTQNVQRGRFSAQTFYSQRIYTETWWAFQRASGLFVEKLRSGTRDHPFTIRIFHLEAFLTNDLPLRGIIKTNEIGEHSCLFKPLRILHSPSLPSEIMKISHFLTPDKYYPGHVECPLTSVKTLKKKELLPRRFFPSSVPSDADNVRIGKRRCTTGRDKRGLVCSETWGRTPVRRDDPRAEKSRKWIPRGCANEGRPRYNITDLS